MKMSITEIPEPDLDNILIIKIIHNGNDGLIKRIGQFEAD